LRRKRKKAEGLAMRRMKLLNIPTTVSFENRKHSRNPSKRSHRAKSAKKISKTRTSENSRGVLIDLPDCDQRESRKESSPLIDHDKDKREDEQKREGVRREICFGETPAM